MENISANRLKKARESKGLNLRELEQLTGISRSTLNRYEKTGLSNVSMDKIYSLCAALNIGENWLLNKEKENDIFFYNSLLEALTSDLNADDRLSVTNIAELIQYSKDKSDIDKINDYLDTKKQLLNYNGIKELKNFLDYLITKSEMLKKDSDKKLDEYKTIINTMTTLRCFDENSLTSKLNFVINNKLNSQPSEED